MQNNVYSACLYIQWNLICNRAHLKAMTQAIYMAGLLVGSYVFSSISDAFGRRVGAFLSILFMVSESHHILGHEHFLS